MSRGSTPLIWAMLLSGSAVAAEPQSDEDLFLIQGRVQKPEVVVVIRRENLDKGFVLELKESFLQRVVDALRQPPF